MEHSDITVAQNALDFWYNFQSFCYDPRKTQKVFEMDNILTKVQKTEDQEKLLEQIENIPGFVELYNDRDTPLLSQVYNIEELIKLPENTFGHQYASFMKIRKLDPNFYEQESVYNTGDYYKNRIRKTHDIMHILAGFDTDVAGEIGVVNFSYSQSVSRAGIAITCALLMSLLKEGDLNEMHLGMKLASLGFSCGCDAKDIRSVRWENLWEKDSEEIRTEYNIIAYDKNVYKKSYTQKLGMT